VTRRLVLAAVVLGSARLFVWPRVEEASAADAVVVLDGDRPRRLRAGLALMDRGLAPVLVVFRGEEQAPELYGPDVQPFEPLSLVPRPSTTRGEALAVAALARRRGWERLLVVTSTYHVTRARRIFRRSVPTELRFVAAGYTPSVLPLHVLSEWLKLAAALALPRAG
jgi:uncharacterized SAM-binding protein YcdF (DUF218 family)